MGCVIIFAVRKVRLREVYQRAWGWLASKGMFLTKPLSYPGYVSRIDLGSMGLIHFLDSLTLRGKEHVEDGSPAYHSWGGQAKVKSRRFPCFAPQPRLP